MPDAQQLKLPGKLCDCGLPKFAEREFQNQIRHTQDCAAITGFIDDAIFRSPFCPACWSVLSQPNDFDGWYCGTCEVEWDPDGCGGRYVGADYCDVVGCATRGIRDRRCTHADSLYGRCTACGMTWTEQANA